MQLSINHPSQFRDAFQAHGRGNQFSYEALGLLFEFLEEVAPDYKLDVIALCCEYTEDSVEAIAANYSIDLSECGGDYYEMSAAVKEFLEENTMLVGETESGFVYANF
jgi:hypothetical protein